MTTPFLLAVASAPASAQPGIALPFTSNSQAGDHLDLAATADAHRAGTASSTSVESPRTVQTAQESQGLPESGEVAPVSDATAAVPVDAPAPAALAPAAVTPVAVAEVTIDSSPVGPVNSDPAEVQATAPSSPAPADLSTATRPAPAAASAAAGDVTAMQVAAAPELQVTTTADVAQASTGSTITFTVKVTNAGTAPAMATLLSDATPAGAAYVPSSARVDNESVPDGDVGDGNPLSSSNGGITLPLVAAGQIVTATFRVVVTATAGTVIQNVAVVRSDAGQFRSSAPALVEVVAMDGAAITAVTTTDAGKSVTSGQVVTWTTKVSNAGDTSAQLQYSDVVPAGTVYVPGSTQVNGVTRPDPATGAPLVSVDLGVLAPGQSIMVAFRATVTAAQEGSTLTNNAVILADGGATSAANSQSAVLVAGAVLAATGASHTQLLLAGLLCLFAGGLLVRPKAPLDRPAAAGLARAPSSRHGQVPLGPSRLAGTWLRRPLGEVALASMAAGTAMRGASPPRATGPPGRASSLDVRRRADEGSRRRRSLVERALAWSEPMRIAAGGLRWESGLVALA